MRTVLICHEEASLHRQGIARWLSSFSELSGILSIREGREMRWRRLRREYRRTGLLGVMDVLAFQSYYRATAAADDLRWRRQTLKSLVERFRAVPEHVPVQLAADPNSEHSARFLRNARPDMIVVFCKHILRPQVFAIAPLGTFVMHPGICPEYRNAHGCFWALARRDLTRVGMTLLRIDTGIDTGPIYGHFSYAFDERTESHVRIQDRVVLENLDAARDRLLEIARGDARPIEVGDRTSAAWGQPTLSSYIAWRRAATRR